MPDIVYEFLEELSPAGEEQVIALYRAAGWWKENPSYTGSLQQSVRGSFAFLVAREGTSGPILGMARALADGVSDGYLQDITVLPEWRGRGIGRELVRRLTARCVERGLVWVGLVAEPGTQAFYEALGYRPMVAYQPMLYSPAADPAQTAGGGR